jgi:tRNA G10  N-methylase Trm11
MLDSHVSSSAYGLFDAILTDPPYGIRAGARKSGRAGDSLMISDEQRESHYPATQRCSAIVYCSISNVQYNNVMFICRCC